MRRIVKAFRRPPTGRMDDRNGGFPRLSDVVAHALRCPASPRRTLKAENLGKPSLWVSIIAPWYYIAHIRETGSDEREPPFFFQKPTDALVLDGGDFPYPPLSENVHYEIELVVAIGRAGRNIATGGAVDHVFGYAVGLDMTRRDLQGVAKEMRRPWEAGKAFDHAAPCSAIVPAADIGHPRTGEIWLKVNGETRQDADLSHQIWSVPESIAHLSELFELVPGDLIFTGTPSGVGPVKPGDAMVGGIDGIGELTVQVV